MGTWHQARPLLNIESAVPLTKVSPTHVAATEKNGAVELEDERAPGGEPCNYGEKCGGLAPRLDPVDFCRRLNCFLFNAAFVPALIAIMSRLGEWLIGRLACALISDYDNPPLLAESAEP